MEFLFSEMRHGGMLPDIIRDQSGISQGSVRDQSGISQGPVRDQSRISQWSLGNQSRITQGALPDPGLVPDWYLTNHWLMTCIETSYWNKLLLLLLALHHNCYHRYTFCLLALSTLNTGRDSNVLLLKLILSQNNTFQLDQFWDNSHAYICI